MIEFIYRQYSYDAGFRVWRSDWAGDMFENLTKQQFAELQLVCRRFGIVLKEAEWD